MNNQAMMLTGVTREEYLKWCKDNNKPVHSKKTEKEFFKKVLNGKIRGRK